jgi:hypothetical protein
LPLAKAKRQRKKLTVALSKGKDLALLETKAK